MVPCLILFKLCTLEKTFGGPYEGEKTTSCSESSDEEEDSDEKNVRKREESQVEDKETRDDFDQRTELFVHEQLSEKNIARLSASDKCQAMLNSTRLDNAFNKDEMKVKPPREVDHIIKILNESSQKEFVSDAGINSFEELDTSCCKSGTSSESSEFVNVSSENDETWMIL
jgi:hypothetical protein